MGLPVYLMVESTTREQGDIRESSLGPLYWALNVRGRDNPNEAEGLGVMIQNADGTRRVTGTTRGTVDRLRGISRPWLSVLAEWPEDWVSGG